MERHYKSYGMTKTVKETIERYFYIEKYLRIPWKDIIML